jgi:FtsH-binding integral membrane protein
VLANFGVKVYAWMAGMLLVTAGTSGIALTVGAVQWLLTHLWVFVALLTVELSLVAAYSRLRKKLSLATGLALMGVYTVLNGLTLSGLLIRYNSATVLLAFLASAGVFGGASFYGFFTKKNLESWGLWLFFGLLGLLVTMIANSVIRSQPMDYLISGVAVLLFTGLAIFDAQVIRKKGMESQTALAALDMALEVYLDFINLFIHVLRLFNGTSYKKD